MVIKVMAYLGMYLTALVILIDIIPKGNDWVSRIHIGRYTDKNKWNKSITQKGIKWLNSTPKIKLTDHTRLVALDMLTGNYSKKTIQYWQEAALVLGIAQFLRNNDDQEAKKEIIKFLTIKFDSQGQWMDKPKYVDGAILAYSIMKLDFIEIDKYKEAFDDTWLMIKEHLGEDGTVAYRTHMKNYRYVDTIGFICPFLVAYGTRYKKEECLQVAVNQIKQYERFGMLDKHDIPYHAYRVDNNLPLGLSGWGRGLGWFAIGLIDAWKELPLTSEYRPVLEESIIKFAKTVMRFQQETGCWNWTVTREECRPDSSTTATLAWFLLNAAKIDEIARECQHSSQKAIDYLMKVTRHNGAVDFSQGDTKDIGVYSMLFNILPFTQGFCMRLINLYKDI